MWQINEGIIKSSFSERRIGLISCYKGFTCGAGASGVGRACTEAFVASFISIIIMNFFFAKIAQDWYIALYGIPKRLSGSEARTLMALIELRQIFKRFGWLEVLNDVSLQIEEGKCLVIIGASGSGKSVMLKHIVGLLKPDRGEVWFSGQRIDNLPERELMKVRERFGFLFQQGALFDSDNVAQNVAFPLVEHTSKKPDENRGNRQPQAADGRACRMWRTKCRRNLSGGQRKRVALARAIALDPEVILYDEPTTGLDPIRSDVINELILKLQRELAGDQRRGDARHEQRVQGRRPDGHAL